MLPGRPTCLGELGVDVDRVEVAGGARVAVRQVLVGRHPELRDRVARLQILQLGHHTPLTMLVQVPFTVCLPSWLVEIVSKT